MNHEEETQRKRPSENALSHETEEQPIAKHARRSKFDEREEDSGAEILKIEAFLNSIERSSIETKNDRSNAERSDALSNFSSKEKKSSPAMYFDVMRGDNENYLGRLDLSGATQLTFGREADRIDICLDHASISRHHATMTFDTDLAYISDFGSTHGTFLRRPRDAKEIKLESKELVQLEPGDIIRFGESSRRYVFQLAKSQPHIIISEPQPNENGIVDLGNGQIKIIAHVPSNTVGRLLNRDALVTKSIQERTGTQITILPPQQPVEDSLRVVSIRGFPQGVATARMEVLAVTSENTGTLIGNNETTLLPRTSSSSYARSGKELSLRYTAKLA